MIRLFLFDPCEALVDIQERRSVSQKSCDQGVDGAPDDGLDETSPSICKADNKITLGSESKSAGFDLSRKSQLSRGSPSPYADPSWSEEQLDAFEERAAIIEFLGEEQRKRAEELAREIIQRSW